jgi:lysine biosynthesis protein LysW
MAIAFCLDCEHKINLGTRPVEGQRVTCSNCGAELEIICLGPLELDWAYLEPAVGEEDWYWDDEWDEEWEEEEEEKAVP